MIRFLSIALICVAYAIAATSKTSLTGDHICHREENYTETVNSTTSEPIQVRKNFWCLEKIRCSELKPEVKEIVETKNVTKTRTIQFCCPNYEEVEENGKIFCRSAACKCVNGNCTSFGNCECELGFTGEFCDEPCPSNRFGDMCLKYCKCGDRKCDPKTGECLKEKFSVTAKPEKPNPEKFEKSLNHSVLMIVPAMTPFRNFNGREFEESNDELQEFDYPEESEFVYFDPNGIQGIDTTAKYLDHHQDENHPHHDESMAMVTVGCVVLAMFVFLIAMIYIRRITRRPRRVDQESNFHDSMKPTKLDPSKLIHCHSPPLPIAPPPLRPSLRKSKSVTFDDSFDEVDEIAEKGNLTYDVPRKQTSMTDLNKTAQHSSIEMTPTKGFNTFPKRISTPNKSLEHIYAEIQLKKA